MYKKIFSIAGWIYNREISKLKHQLRFAKKPKNFKKLNRAQGKLRRIAFKIFEDMVGQLDPAPKQSYYETFDLLFSVLTQKKDDKNKIYSLHEPDVLCIAKGKNISHTNLGIRFHSPIPGNQGSLLVLWQ